MRGGEKGGGREKTERREGGGEIFNAWSWRWVGPFPHWR